MQVYRTYAKEIIDEFRPIVASFCNKPKGGLWGCRGTEWYDWCTAEEFSDVSTYFEWHLKEGTKVYTIENENDFIYLLNTYPHFMMGIIDSIDFMKMWSDGYDAVEIMPEVNNRLHMGMSTMDGNLRPKNVTTARLINDKRYSTAMLMVLNVWDLPSICVFDPQETVCVVSHLKSHFTHKEVENLSEAVMYGGTPYVSN